MKTKKKIKKILKNFNFEQTHRVMEFLNWTWFDTDGQSPSADRLKELAEKMLWKVSQDEGISSFATGGLKATKFENGTLMLEFVVTDWMIEE